MRKIVLFFDSDNMATLGTEAPACARLLTVLSLGLRLYGANECYGQSQSY